MQHAVVPSTPATSLARRITLGDALAEALRQHPGITASAIAGAARRRAPCGEDLTLVVAATDVASVWAALHARPEVEVLACDPPAQLVGLLRAGGLVQVRIAAPDGFGAALIHATGSPAHVSALRARAARRGLRLDGDGLWDAAAHRRVAGASEADVYAALGLPLIPAELREGRDELELADAGRVPRLVDEADLVGDLHVRVTLGDGADELDELLDAASRRGLRHLAVVARVHAPVLDLDSLADHVTQVRAASSRRLRLAAGVELEVGDGTCPEVPASTLAMLDWVVAAVADPLATTPELATRALLRAIERGVVDAVRIPPGTPPAPILAAARRRGVVIELDAAVAHLEHTVETARAARAAGVPVAPVSGARGAWQLDRVRAAVWAARRAGLETDDVLGALGWNELIRWRERRLMPGGRRRRA